MASNRNSDLTRLTVNNLVIGYEGKIKIIPVQSKRDPEASQYQFLSVTGSNIVSGLQTRCGEVCEARTRYADPSEPGSRTFQNNNCALVHGPDSK
jgi:hypothetical protein